MRVHKSHDGIIVQAVAGTHVVYLGWDIKAEVPQKNLLGFAIQRTDHTENETYWLRGIKTFPGTNPPLAPGEDASSHDQPYQTFQWGDYTAKAEHSYSYTIIAMYGKRGALQDGNSITVDITTETALGATHSVFFNRGAIASQEYARRFQNAKPSKVGEAAYQWLSRGLFEAIVGFIQRAKADGWGIRAAIYEFQWPGVLEELKAAKDRGADVRVVYDAIPNAKKDPVKKNEAAIAAARIKGICNKFTDGTLMHNKFFVLTKKDKPVAVLTGSTNVSENGIFGHLNCAHIVEDAGVASTYLDYWEQLKSDPGSATLKEWTGENSPSPDNPPPAGITKEFSPQVGKATLQTYGAIADGAQKALFMTFAFGMSNVFLPVYEQDDKVLRFALMERAGNGKTAKQQAEDIARVRKLPNVLVAIGHNIAVNSFDRWLKEIASPIEKPNVRWIHTKFMLVDPLGDDPVVITGSANFSEASTTTNEENMLIIRGDTRVADIYFGEYMRTFAHYAFREAVYIRQQQGVDADDWKPQDLIPDSSWLKRYTKPGSNGALRRLYFSGQ
jgi:phosphatidylserine/phosphatidylglycerophosphate/cardiolipin synthase-like enzyme